MVFTDTNGMLKDPNRDCRCAHYKCQDCPTEFTITLEVGDRKLKRWCKNCKHFIYSDQVINIKMTRREVRVTKSKSLW